MTHDPILLHRMARNYLACVYPFPPGLRPEHLEAPDQEQVLAGLHILHRALTGLYQAFNCLERADAKAISDEDYCWKTMEGSTFLLWTMGALGERIAGP